VFLVPVANLVISDARVVVGRCVTAPSLFFLRELIVWSSLLCLVPTMVHLLFILVPAVGFVVLDTGIACRLGLLILVVSDLLHRGT
jgi:hypothetical protein